MSQPTDVPKFTREELEYATRYDGSYADLAALGGVYYLAALDRIERARSLLKSLVEHEEIVGGSLVQLSTSYRLAKAVLAALDGEGGGEGESS